MTKSFEELLDQYAEVAVKVGVNLQAGQRLVINVTVDLAPFVRLVAKHAYQAGAKYVYIVWNDQHLNHAQLEYGSDDSLLQYPDWVIKTVVDFVKNGDARLSIYAEDPNLMADIDPQRLQIVRKVAAENFKPLRDLTAAGIHPNYAVISAAYPGWARRVFPALSDEQATAKLWDAIFAACRINTPDPVAAWKAHNANLQARQDYLTAKRYTALHYRAPGTDLRVGLPQGHIWIGGSSVFNNIECFPNIPTEEVFTLPHREQIDGVVSATMPLSVQGKLIEGFALTFENGRIVKATADKAEDHLNHLIDLDDGARSLGEVALVPHSSPISQLGILFYNGLYDENASCHMALGDAYRYNLENGEGMSEEAFNAAGGNTSSIHTDFMMGSGLLDVDGIHSDRTNEPIMRQGEWAFTV
jgi:aminopeptidase